jgi:TonB family protein
MMFKIHIAILMCLLGLTPVCAQHVDSLSIAKSGKVDSSLLNGEGSPTNAELETIDPERQKQIIADKFDLTLENGISSKMLSNGVLFREPDLNSSPMDIIIQQNEKVYAYKYFVHERCWLINYKSNWGFVEDYLIMAVKEQDFTSYKDQWDTPPKIKTSINPKYPKEAKKAKVEGSVELRIFIDDKGVVTQTIILNGIDGLNDAAIEAINKAKFEPAQKNGKKTGVWVPTRIKFKL